MNRIREIRELAGLSVLELANRVGTSDTQIRRLEQGKRRLTEDWMQRIARALDCTPADLIATAVAAEAVSEVEVIDSADLPSWAAGLRARGIVPYRVLGRSVELAGIGPDATITVDESVTTPKAGDVVLVRLVRQDMLILRQFVPPNLIVTNRRGANLAIQLDDRLLEAEIVGVVLPNPA